MSISKVYGCIFPSKYFVLSKHKVFCLLAPNFFKKKGYLQNCVNFLENVALS